MTVNGETVPERYERTVECPCGVVLDLRTQGLLCPACRARSRRERKRNMAEAWERFHRRHRQPTRSDAPSVEVESLIDAIDRLVGALESGRPAYVRSRPSTSRVLSKPPAAQAQRAGGIPVDRLEAE